jgi:hypothetical protein
VGVRNSENVGLQLHDVKFPNEIKLEKVELLLFFYVNVHVYVKCFCFREGAGNAARVDGYYRDIGFGIFGKGNFLS